MASYVENVFNWWRHRDVLSFGFLGTNLIEICLELQSFIVINKLGVFEVQRNLIDMQIKLGKEDLSFCLENRIHGINHAH